MRAVSCLTEGMQASVRSSPLRRGHEDNARRYPGSCSAETSVNAPEAGNASWVLFRSVALGAPGHSEHGGRLLGAVGVALSPAAPRLLAPPR